MLIKKNCPLFFANIYILCNCQGVQTCKCLHQTGCTNTLAKINLFISKYVYIYKASIKTIEAVGALIVRN